MISNTCKFLIGLLTIFLLSNCAIVGPIVEEPEEAAGQTLIKEDKELAVRLKEEVAEEVEEKVEEYVLGRDDVIGISVWRHAEASSTATVDPYGKVSLPIVGEIQAESLTRLQLEKKVARRLAKYYKNPSVRVVITEYNNRRIYVLGQVSQPGTQILGGRPDLLGVISRAGGATQNADLRGCSIVRGKGKIIKIDLYELLVKGNISLNITIQPNDLIYVPDNTGNQVYVLGEVRNPGLYSLRGEYTIAHAVMSAGGPTEDAALNRAKVLRGDLGKPEIITIPLEEILKKGDRSRNILLEPADIVYLPDRFMARFNYFVRQILPSLQTIVLTDEAGETLSF